MTLPHEKADGYYAYPYPANKITPCPHPKKQDIDLLANQLYPPVNVTCRGYN
jgi:hypothetical protein